MIKKHYSALTNFSKHVHFSSSTNFSKHILYALLQHMHFFRREKSTAATTNQVNMHTRKLHTPLHHRQAYLDSSAVWDGVDEGVKVESWQVGVLCLDEHHVGGVVPATKQQALSLTSPAPHPLSIQKFAMLSQNQCGHFTTPMHLTLLVTKGQCEIWPIRAAKWKITERTSAKDGWPVSFKKVSFFFFPYLLQSLKPTAVAIRNCNSSSLLQLGPVITQITIILIYPGWVKLKQ